MAKNNDSLDFKPRRGRSTVLMVLRRFLFVLLLVVVFVVGFWFLVGCCEGGRGWRMRTP